MKEPADGELMVRYGHGSQAAFEELFRRYESRAYGYFLRRVGCEALARDLYQELFLRIHRFRRTYDPKRPFAPWFFHVARCVLVDEWRRRSRRAEVLFEESLHVSPESDAEERAAALEIVERQLGRLSPEDARILVYAKGWGFEYAEIAEALKKSTDAVKQTASRSLRRLRAVAEVATWSDPLRSRGESRSFDVIRRSAVRRLPRR